MSPLRKLTKPKMFLLAIFSFSQSTDAQASLNFENQKSHPKYSILCNSPVFRVDSKIEKAKFICGEKKG